MIHNSILVRYSEIGTKSRQTRKKWENTLIYNIKGYLKIGFRSMFCLRGRIIILTEEICDLKNIFGVASFSPAIRVEQDIEKIKEKAGEIYSGKRFRVSTRRITKEFPYSSQRVNEIVGEYLVKKGGKVDLENFEEEIGIEFLNNYVYIYKEKIRGAGGLPVGVQGRVLCFLEDEKDIKAAYLMLKRGCEIDYCGKDPRELYKYSTGHKISEYNKETQYVFAVSGKNLDNFEELLETKKEIENTYGMKTLFPMLINYD